MLNWLKKKAKVSFSSRYPNILRRSNSPEMFLPDETMMTEEAGSSKIVKLCIYNPNGIEYSLSVPPEMTLEKIKMMAVGHFYDPKQAVTEPSASTSGFQSGESKPTYRLVLVRDFRELQEEKSITDENLIDNDKILLVERRPPNYKHPIFSDLPTYQSSECKATLEQINRETANLPSRNIEPVDNAPPCALDVSSPNNHDNIHSSPSDVPMNQ